MHLAKLDFLTAENLLLKKQLAEIQKTEVFDSLSNDNQKSLLFQLRAENDELRMKISTLQCEIILEKQARTIEKVNY